MKQVLIVGGAGGLGTALVRQLLDQKFLVVVASRSGAAGERVQHSYVIDAISVDWRSLYSTIERESGAPSRPLGSARCYGSHFIPRIQSMTCGPGVTFSECFTWIRNTIPPRHSVFSTWIPRSTRSRTRSSRSCDRCCSNEGLPCQEHVRELLPWAIGFVLLPKVAQRDATGQDPRPILLLSLAASMAPGLLLTPLYLFAPGALVRIIFTGAYADPGIVLGLAGLAATHYAGVNIWLIYALALRRSAYVYLLAAILALQAAGMYALGRDSLIHMAMAMVGAGLLGNVAGYLSTWFRPHCQA